MKYSDITVNDPNVAKRYLQRSRFRTAVALYPEHHRPMQVLDFGGGDAELCLQLAAEDRESSFICYEPAQSMRAQAAARIRSADRIRLIDDIDSVVSGSCDAVYSLEVFEHLPPAEFAAALEQMFRVLKPGGKLVIGVPNELYLAALYKGIFRMFRRFGAYDARPWNILRSTLGSPPQNRPIEEISPGMKYHFHHVGFDHRVLRRALDSRVWPVLRVFSPLRLLGPLLSPEIYYTAEKP